MMMANDAKNTVPTAPFGRMSRGMTLVVLAAAAAAWFPLQALVSGWPLATRVAMAAVVGGLAGTIVSLLRLPSREV